MPTDTNLYGVNSTLTLGDIRDAIFTELKEDPDEPIFWTAEEINGYINQAITAFCQKHDIFIKYDEIDSVSGTMIYNLTLGMAQLKAIGYDGVDITNNQISIDEIDLITTGASDKWGKYGLGAIFLNAIPDEDDKKILVMYRALHTTLVDDSDILYIDSLDIYEGIKSYAKWKALEKDSDGQDVIKSKTFRKDFRERMGYIDLLLNNNDVSMVMGGKQ